MSLNLPAKVEQDIQRYAQIEKISTDAAAIKLIQVGLKAAKRKTIPQTLTEAQLEQLKASPTAAFFGELSDQVLEQMERASKQIHAERFTSRG